MPEPAAATADSTWWRPTLADGLILILIAWTFLVTPNGSAEFLGDANTGMHIRTGDLIRATGSVPHTDPFSYSKPGEPWFAWEWLTAIVYSLLNQAFGLPGVALLSLVVLGATFAITLRSMIRAGSVAIVAVPLLFFAFRASSIHFLARPHLFTWLFLAIAVAVVEADRREPTNRVWWLVGLSLLWANVHGGFPILAIYLGLIAVGSAAEQRWPTAWKYALLSATAGAVTFINPYGWRVHEHIWQMMNSPWLVEMVQEFQPPWTMADERIYIYYVLLALAVVAAGASLLGKGATRRYTEPLVIIFFGYLSLKSMRHVPLFLIASLPTVASFYSGLWRSFAAKAGRKSTLGVLEAISRDRTPQLRSLSLAGLILATAGFALPGHLGMPQDFSGTTYPREMIAAHHAELERGRLFTHDGWADYLEYRSFPKQKVWVDGRGDFFGPTFGHEYLTMIDADPGTQEIMARWGFDTVLIRPSVKLAKWLAAQPEWHEVARDKQAVLFVRTSPTVAQSSPSARLP